MITQNKCAFCTTPCGNSYCPYSESDAVSKQEYLRVKALLEATLDSYEKLEKICENQKIYIKQLEGRWYSDED